MSKTLYPPFSVPPPPPALEALLPLCPPQNTHTFTPQTSALLPLCLPHNTHTSTARTSALLRPHPPDTGTLSRTSISGRMTVPLPFPHTPWADAPAAPQGARPSCCGLQGTKSRGGIPFGRVGRTPARSPPQPCRSQSSSSWQRLPAGAGGSSGGFQMDMAPRWVPHSTSLPVKPV
eukprot:363324-Chlamydomonas_euryale.AAC.10